MLKEKFKTMALVPVICREAFNICDIWARDSFNVSFPHEAIRGLDFFSAQIDAFPVSEVVKGHE